MSPSRIFTLMKRALLLRCPNCGRSKAFISWFRMREECPVCGFHMERKEQGYIVGAYMFNIVAAELIWAAIVLSVMGATWPTPPWDLLLYGGGALMLVLPFVTYPFSKTVFIGFDLIFRPAGEADSEMARPWR